MKRGEERRNECHNTPRRFALRWVAQRPCTEREWSEERRRRVLFGRSAMSVVLVLTPCASRSVAFKMFASFFLWFSVQLSNTICRVLSFHKPSDDAVNNNNSIPTKNGSSSAPTSPSSTTKNGGNKNASNLPQRPTSLDCIFYLRNGKCKYGKMCKYHHPLDRVARSKPDNGSSNVNNDEVLTVKSSR